MLGKTGVWAQPLLLVHIIRVVLECCGTVRRPRKATGGTGEQSRILQNVYRESPRSAEH